MAAVDHRVAKTTLLIPLPWAPRPRPTPEVALTPASKITSYFVIERITPPSESNDHTRIACSGRIRSAAMKRSNSGRPALPLALLMGALAFPLGSCSQSEGGSSASAVEASSTGARPREASKVRTQPVEQREMTSILETTTVLESEREISIIPRAGGIVIELLAEEGDSVEAGQVLARLDSRDQNLALKDAEVALEEARSAEATAEFAVQEAQSQIENSRLAAEQAERDYTRDERLFEGEGTVSGLSAKALEAGRLLRDQAEQEYKRSQLAWKRSKIELDKASISVGRAEVALERARITLGYMEVVAPFGGVVAERTARVGDSVSTAEPVFTLTDPVNLRAVFYRPQRELALFSQVGDAEREDDDLGVDSEGLEVTATAEAIPGTVFNGHIVRTSPTIDADSGSFRVTAKLEVSPGNGQQLLPGMLARLLIVTDRHPGALVVPKRAVRRESDRSYILVVRERLARRIDVREGYSDDDFVEIVVGPDVQLQTGERVIVVGSRELVDGSEVDDEAQLQAAPAKQLEALPVDSKSKSEAANSTVIANDQQPTAAEEKAPMGDSSQGNASESTASQSDSDSNGSGDSSQGN